MAANAGNLENVAKKLNTLYPKILQYLPIMIKELKGLENTGKNVVSRYRR